MIGNPLDSLKKIIALSTNLASESDLTVLLGRIANAARQVVGAEGAMVALLDQTKDNLRIDVLEITDHQIRRTDFPVFPLKKNGNINSSNICVHSIFTGQAVQVDDVYKYSGFDFEAFYSIDRLLSFKTKSLLSLPLVNNKVQTVGVLLLINALADDHRGITSFDKSKMELAEGFAAQAAVAIWNAQLNEENKRLINILEKTNESLEKENRRLKNAIDENYDFSEIIGQSAAIKKVFHFIKKVLNSDAAILVQGETGSGKELIAKALHFNSIRKNKPFVTQNCAALPENLLESELFGYKKGAFSGATTDKKGLIEQADGGTLFLDEIGDMPLSLQAKLLRVLQEREVRPLGSVETKKVNLRVVSATHHDLKKLAEEGKFREDLVYRLSVFPIMLPPLRERKEDLPELVNHFVNHFSNRYKKDVKGVAPRAYEILTQYEYPGNIRELRNILERAVLLCEDGLSITPDSLPDELLDRRRPEHDSKPASREVTSGNKGLKKIVEEYEAKIIRKSLQDHNWNQSQTAIALSVGRRTLIEKIQRYEINSTQQVSSEV
ncbi:MAG: sigma 54-interacting transcriptional regulator [Gammaproteobacteria bacterium]|nr:sigma 54-interacting transcriptional regulator [Gammaproteobacteria bacterium]